MKLEIEGAKVWGLTGGIASGKSAVAKLFEKEGFFIIDADQVARELRAPGGAAHEAVFNLFKTHDAKEIRKKVFSDPISRKKLESLLHPLIRKSAQDHIQKQVELTSKSKRPLKVIYEASLLVETGTYPDFNGLIVVTAPIHERIERLKKRDQISEDDARAILQSQISDEERNKHAQFIIENSGSQETLSKTVHALAVKLAASTF